MIWTWILTTWAIVLVIISDYDQNLTNQGIPPDHARVSGIIISQISSPNETGFCQQYPCWAYVKISEVLGYGSGFSRAITLGDTLKIRFATTLLPTESIFDNRETHLPGLASGDTFQADIKQKLVLNNSLKENAYEVNQYSKN